MEGKKQYFHKAWQNLPLDYYTRKEINKTPREQSKNRSSDFYTDLTVYFDFN